MEKPAYTICIGIIWEQLIFVTNSHGDATQFLLNLPFGETMLEQMHGSYNNPYKFNGKELDEDTGLYYYGARYYNPRLSIWYGVDPLAEKYPNLSPYAYVANNPIKYIDPDGQDIVPYFVNNMKYKGGKPGNFNVGGYNYKLYTTKNYVSTTMDLALKKFAKSDTGKAFLLQYMKKGQSFYGIKASEDGSLSDKNLNLYDIRNDNKNNIARRNVMGSDGVMAEGKTDFDEKSGDLNVYIDTVSKGTSTNDVNSTLETVAHEFGKHGTKHSRYLNLLNAGKSEQLSKERGEDFNKDHVESKNPEGAKVYNGIMKDLNMKPQWE